MPRAPERLFLNIVFVNPEYPSRSGHDHGGIATYIYTMANALAARGHTVHVLVKSKTVPDALDPGIRFHTLDHAPSRRFFAWMDKLLKNDSAWEYGYSLAARELILRLHGECPVDCVEIPEYNGLASAFAQPLPFPVVVHFHTPTYLIDSFNHVRISFRQKKWYVLEARALSRAHSFRSPSVTLKEEVSRHYGIDAHRIAVIPHPVDVSAYDVIRREAPSAGRIDLLFSGRLERRKGGEILLRDIRRILDLDPRINITLAGELDMGEAGNYRSAIERSLSEKQRHALWLVGPTKRPDLAVLFRRSHMLLMPSLFENAPYTLLEAMAAQLPIIASRTGGIAELILHGETGLLFDPDNQDGLVECVKAFISSPQQAASCARKAYEFVVDKCAPDKISAQALEYYQTVADSFKATPSSRLRR